MPSNHVDAATQTLEATLQLGREAPLLADYVYILRAKNDSRAVINGETELNVW
jgi:hypothetical protein